MNAYNLVKHQGYPNDNKYRAYDVKELPGVVVVQVHGTWRESDYIPLQTDAKRLHWNNLVLDLSNTMYIDANALGSIVGTHVRILKDKGTVKLSGLTKRISDLFEITKLKTAFNIYSTLDDAISSYAVPEATQQANAMKR